MYKQYMTALMFRGTLERYDKIPQIVLCHLFLPYKENK